MPDRQFRGPHQLYLFLSQNSLQTHFNGLSYICGVWEIGFRQWILDKEGTKIGLGL